MSDTPITDSAYFRGGATMYDLAGEMKKIERDLKKAQDHLELAWCVIANAGHKQGGWLTQDKEWVESAERWREKWHEILSLNVHDQQPDEGGLAESAG